jgi:hypothetical protein
VHIYAVLCTYCRLNWKAVSGLRKGKMTTVNPVDVMS